MGSDNKPLNLNQKMKFMISLLSLIFSLETNVAGHARLLEPPSRASMWRFGFQNPPDYQDNEGFCGGFQVQWEINGGKCGIRGDRYDSPVKEHEAPGGRFANGIIVREYQPGGVMNITVDVTANHKGFFTFRMCPVVSEGVDPDQECFDRPENLLQVIDTESEKFTLPDQLVRQYQLSVQLPADLQCDHCVLQWTYTTGNNWGICSDGSGEIGCGPQENFRACSDLRIRPQSNFIQSQTLKEAKFLPKSEDFAGSQAICAPAGPYVRVPGM